MKKKTAKKAKRAPKRKTGVKNGDRLVCDDCGLEMIVDEECGCEEVHPVICCGEPMSRAR